MGFYKSLCPSCMNEVGDANTCPYCNFDLTAEQVAPYLPYGTVLAGKYAVGDVLEQNSEGVTYLGLDTITNNCVRIREFLPDGLVSRDKSELKPVVSDEQSESYQKFRKDFLNLWHTIMKLKTLESMITVLDVFEANDTAYAVAEADGSKTLTEYLNEKGGTLEWSEITEKIFPAAQAVFALNEAGIVLGALSPDTLFLCSNGQFKPWGFSIAEVRKTEGAIPADIRPGYAAIEQYGNDRSLSPATDVYGFTAVLGRGNEHLVVVDFCTGQVLRHLHANIVDAQRERAALELLHHLRRAVVGIERRLGQFHGKLCRHGFGKLRRGAVGFFTGVSLGDLCVIKFIQTNGRHCHSSQT